MFIYFSVYTFSLKKKHTADSFLLYNFRGIKQFFKVFKRKCVFFPYGTQFLLPSLPPPSLFLFLFCFLYLSLLLFFNYCDEKHIMYSFPSFFHPIILVLVLMIQWFRFWVWILVLPLISYAILTSLLFSVWIHKNGECNSSYFIDIVRIKWAQVIRRDLVESSASN